MGVEEDVVSSSLEFEMEEEDEEEEEEFCLFFFDLGGVLWKEVVWIYVFLKGKSEEELEVLKSFGFGNEEEEEEEEYEEEEEEDYDEEEEEFSEVFDFFFICCVVVQVWLEMVFGVLLDENDLEEDVDLELVEIEGEVVEDGDLGDIGVELDDDQYWFDSLLDVDRELYLWYVVEGVVELELRVLEDEEKLFVLLKY